MLPALCIRPDMVLLDGLGLARQDRRYMEHDERHIDCRPLRSAYQRFADSWASSSASSRRTPNNAASFRTTRPSESITVACPRDTSEILLLTGVAWAGSTDRRFIESESDLDGALKQFLTLTQNPALYYPELVKQGTASLLASLLSHENTDIAVDVIEIIQELTDEDVGAGGDELDGDEVDEEDEQKAAQVRMVMAELIDELVSQPYLHTPR